MPSQTDPATVDALMRMASGGPSPLQPMDFMTGAPKRQPGDLQQVFQQMDALRKALPLSFKAKKGGGVLTYKGRF
jgi:hypothetical protein